MDPVVTPLVEEEEEEESASIPPVPVIPAPAPAPTPPLSVPTPAGPRSVVDFVTSAVEGEKEESGSASSVHPPIFVPPPAGPTHRPAAASKEVKPLSVSELLRRAVPASFPPKRPAPLEAAIEDVPRFIVPGGNAVQRDVALSSDRYGSITFLHPICLERFPFPALPMLTECRFQLFADGVQPDVGDFCPMKVVMKRVWPVSRLSRVRERGAGGRSLVPSLKKLVEQKGLIHQRYDPAEGVWEFRADFISDFPIEAPKS
jgi:hypothetical protein